MREKFDQELHSLNDLLLEMSLLMEQAIVKSIQLIHVRNKSLAEEVYRLEETIDSYEERIQNTCLRLIIEQQPMAGDLRYISAALKMITDMERIGDHARDIAEICMMIPKDYVSENFHLIDVMAEATVKLLKKAIDSFICQDIDQAREMDRADDQVDRYFVLLRDEMIEVIQKKAVDPTIVIDFLMIAKYLERIADHGVNIGDWVIFSLQG